MPSIALITEGLTDQIVIERLIEAVCPTTPDDPLLVTYAQPIRDRTDAHHAPHAGWAKVFEYCEHTLEDALATNDLVLVHIDTDDGEHIHYGLPLTADGKDRDYIDLAEGAKSILIAKMGASATAEALQRIIFAIAVHATESWLLLILYDETRLKNPFARLAHHQRKLARFDKEARPYQNLTNSIKDKAILKHRDSAHSLGLFLRDLTGKLSPPEIPSADLSELGATPES
tara:strand:+ start:1825 stop:2514 length:690 start_codon:yes stop_codon:yes gene_type:complete